MIIHLPSTTFWVIINPYQINQDTKMTKKVIIKIHKDHSEIKNPRVAHGGTSAAFDLAASETTTIKANSRATVPTGIRLSIPQTEPYYMMIHLRSSLGFKYGLRCHIGIVDAGYTGCFGVSVVNNTNQDFTINKGEYFAQVLVLEKPSFEFEVLGDGEWEAYEAQQYRGTNGFGSSGK